MIDDLAMFRRFCAGLPNFFRNTIDLQQARVLLKDQYRVREQSFLATIAGAVYARSESPYRKLLAWAGAQLGDVQSLVKHDGIESALGRLKDAGVYLTFDEFKGRKPILRPGLEIAVRAEDFDNPVLEPHFEALTGGSSGVRRRLTIDFALLEHDAAAHWMILSAFDIAERPFAVWRPVPPGGAGVKRALLHEKTGHRLDRWFSQNDTRLSLASVKSHIFLQSALVSSRIWGLGLPSPIHAPIERASIVAEWLEEQRLAGSGGHVDTNVSCAVRLCQAAKDSGADVSGAFFRLGGEPLTDEKAALFREAGCRVACNYTLSEAGTIGVGCADPVGFDDVHVLTDKMCVLQGGPAGAMALYLTCLLPNSPKLLINVESGDSAVMETRRCSCEVGELGFHQHLRHIRSYEKLTSEGMQFMGSDLLDLVERVLPQAFGGNATDYQFVEEDVGGLTRVSVFVHPRLGGIEESAVLRCILEKLGSHSRGDRMMAERWQHAKTLRLVRQAPLTTGASKVLALHVRR